MSTTIPPPAPPADTAVASTSQESSEQAQQLQEGQSSPSRKNAPKPRRDSKSAPAEKKQQQQQQQQGKPKNAAPSTDSAAGNTGEKQLSGAELKKRAKAEKAARRAREKLEREQAGTGASGQAPSPASSSAGKKGGQAGMGVVGAKEAAALGIQKGQRQSMQRRGSGQFDPQQQQQQQQQQLLLLQKKKKDDKSVAVFGHLYGQQRRTTVAGAAKEVHPAVLALGLQMRDYVVCGSNARCVATLLAFKRVIESYTTPLGTSLARHLTTHLSHQITYLSTCRPLSISQGNAIRALKLAISSIDPAVPEASAKASLCDFIDSFIREKITVADQVIASSAAQKIQDNDVIVTFAGSSIVKQTLLTAHKQGKKFRVSIIDSRPLFEGKELARVLATAGLEVQYSLIHGISHAIKDATKVFLGAHAMTSNGRLYSRVGTALVAMSAKERSGGVEIPVIVCCETVKFTDRVALDSIVVNEIADADELVTTPQPLLRQVTGLVDPAASQPEPKKGGKSAAAAGKAGTEPGDAGVKAPLASPLTEWKETPNLQLLNIMYDVTPAEYVDMVVTEMGSLPPSAVPIVHRMSTNA